MGVSIHWKLAQDSKFVDSTLDHAKDLADLIKKNQADSVGIPFSVHRGVNYLEVNIGECEPLLIEFQSMKHWEKVANGGWSYQDAVLSDLKAFDRDDRYGVLFWAAGFCKTQYSKSLVEHKWVADILRFVASRCQVAHVSDEGDYYHSGRVEDAAEAISENGAMIDQLGSQLAGGGFDVIKGGSTKIKPIRKKHGK